jgi:hypothetical protein
MDYEQPTSQILPIEENVTYAYGTWPADTWVPIPQTEDQFHENVMEPTSEVVEPPAQFEFAGGYGQTDYEQPTSQILPTEEIITYEYGTWPADTWVPIPQTENQFHEDVVEPTSEVVEPPAEFKYARGYGQMDYEQPMSQILPTEEILTYDYGTLPADTWMPIPQTGNEFLEDVMEPTSEVVEPPAQFEFAGVFGQMDYEQPIFQILMAKEIITYDYGTWPVGTWVPTLHRDNSFFADSAGQMPPGYLQYPPQLEWMNPYQW